MLGLKFQPFIDFIRKNSSDLSLERYDDITLGESSYENDLISAKVRDGSWYEVEISLDRFKVNSAYCSCDYNGNGLCKHIMNVMVNYDAIVKNQRIEEVKLSLPTSSYVVNRVEDKYIIENRKVIDLSFSDIKQFANRFYCTGDSFRLRSGVIGPNYLKVEVGSYYSAAAKCTIEQRDNLIVATCSCTYSDNRLCEHLTFVFQEIAVIGEFSLPFNESARHVFLKKSAQKYNLENHDNLDDIFDVFIENNRITAHPKFNILNFDQSSLKMLKKQLDVSAQLPKKDLSADKFQFLLLSLSPYNNAFEIQIMEASITAQGMIKNPITPISSKRMLQNFESPALFRFYSSLKIYQDALYDTSDVNDLIQTMEVIFENPLGLPFYFFDAQASNNGKVTSKTIERISVKRVVVNATIAVKQQNDYFVLTCSVKLDNDEFNSKSLKLIGDFFVWSGNVLFFIDNPHVLAVLKFFGENKHELFIHTTQFPNFQEEFLNRLENSMSVEYELVKPAPKKLVKQQQLDVISEFMIYLSESDDYILITPVVRYGDSEVGALSKRNVYAENPAGGLYLVERKLDAEERFIRSIRSQHPLFEEQIDNTEFFYLDKRRFLDEGWFLDAFHFWREHNYSILGFSQIKNNRLNTNRMVVSSQVNSGIDWFEVDATVEFGDQKVSLKEIQKSVVNKSKYIELGDGTLGILPEEWVNKFGNYFRSGEIKDGKIRIHKTNFTIIDELFERDVLSTEVQNELMSYRDKLNDFQSISNVKVSPKLKTTLRDYQKEGLNWLNFLDEFGFGGCLADDMGLGKTVQMIAYFLLQIEKGNTKPNLVVIPTSLLFNWKIELKKFAPHLKVKTIYGLNRDLENGIFDKYNLVLTTYGTLLSDIEVLKDVQFNCIVLDESQAIKNPSSKRYKAVRLLQARQRLVMTGTPLENNTFDLYAQLSFVLPGLLGSAKAFATNYSTPIDKFQDTSRAKELQAKIHPFVLRRTKSQVAKELPEKIEMVIHCEMGTEQRRVYNAYKKEFQDMLKGLDQKDEGSSLHILQGLTKLRQICNSPALLSDEAYYGAESAKLIELMEQIQSKKGEHKILVFSQFVTMLDLVKEQLDKANIGYAYLTGKTKDRQKQVDLFQNDESIRVFLISLKAGGTGLNLTKAEYVFLIDPWWNPAVENQAIDRAHRIGQENKVVAVRLITPNTIEEKIIELQQRKKQLATDLVHTDTAVLKQLSREDLMKMV